ncbi:hypothetical protein [Bradyrhizobium neotropicale]|uniref:hypothetical protein n=1 Tax=Bradyrhizobium neotropicale TaxID=1497615 RepID=UPI001AD78D11|nr:hypothetical protein [Bradyrhizobium neotropicale]MBO4228140.1 hypothetical protein [Bradyrhizobium neotropicale]
MKQLCFEYPYGAFPVRLYQTGFDRFTVEYGKQVRQGLSYGAAAAELGALMHMAACDGRLDNRTRAEAKKAGDSKPFFGDTA